MSEEERDVPGNDVTRAGPTSDGDHDGQDTDAITDRQDTDAIADRQDTDAITDRQDTDAITDRQDTDAITDRQDTDAITDRQDGDAVPGDRDGDTAKPVVGTPQNECGLPTDRRGVALVSARVLFDGVLAGVLAVLVVRSTLGPRPVALPTGASTLGIVLLASLWFACGVASSVRRELAARADPRRVNGAIVAASTIAASLVLLPAAGVGLDNWTVGVGEPFLGFTLTAVVLVVTLLFAAFGQAVTDRRLLLDRAVATCVDGGLAVAATSIVVWHLVPAVWRYPPTGATGGEVVGIVLALFLCSAAVRVPFEVYDGGSVGKYVAGIRVVGDSGVTPAARAVLVRNLLRPIDSLPVGYVVGLAFVGTRDGRRIGDELAGTRVVRVD